MVASSGEFCCFSAIFHPRFANYPLRRHRAHSAQPERPFYPFPMPPRPHLGEARIDELECCNLHVTVPAETTADSKLPVFVFIHGGGFVFGTADYSILDGRPLVNRVNFGSLSAVGAPR